MTRVLIFAKAPVPGRVKTRLVPAIGEDGAADLARAFLQNTIRAAKAAGIGAVEVCADPDPADPAWGDLLTDVEVSEQGEGDLGQRLARAAEHALGTGEPILLIGTDCPDLDTRRLQAAAAALDGRDAVIHPAQDGGYVLLGLTRFDPSLFQGIAWSTDTVCAATVGRLGALGWTYLVAETLRDIDTPADLQTLRLR